MPIYVVGERNQRVSIPNEALAVSIAGSVAEAELDVRAGAQQLVVRPTAHRAVLPEIAGEVTVGVRPVGTARFGAGTVVHLEIAHDNPTDQRLHASLILGFTDASALAAFFDRDEITMLSDRLSVFASAVHAYKVSETLTYVKEGKALPHYQT